ncbi:MAG TPA: S8 family peptidase [Methanothrix sp.]|nr:S8 family peptidase [Methanothrix sp.]
MNRNILFLLAAGMILAAASISHAEVSADNAGKKIDSALAEMMLQGHSSGIPVIIMLKSDDAAKFSNSDGLTVRYRYRLIPGLAGDATAQAIKDLAKDDRVSEIYFDGSTQISAPHENISEEDSSSAQSAVSASFSLENYVPPYQLTKADRLWEKGIDGKGVTVAVIDSGIDKNHPDLVGRVVAEKNFLADEVTADDLLGHGTMVAGIIAGSGAASNGKYRGIAPGASLINVKVIDREGDGKVSDIIAGIEWAVYSGADVLSLSLGGINLGETNPPITMAADNAAASGVVVCVAAGNRNSSEVSASVGSTADRTSERTASSRDGDSSIVGTTAQISQKDQSDKSDNNVLLLLVPIVLALPPGLIDSPGDGVKVITVGAADSNGRMASFSGSGPTRDDRVKPDVVAPGVDIISTVPSGLSRPVYVDDYYARESGTSLSTPVAAGLSALLLHARENLSAAGVKAAMTRGAAKLVTSEGDPYEEYYQGAGMLDALASYELLQNDTPICGVIPDSWTAGRWAYLPAGKGVYVGLDSGADRPQKKIYALAPGDDDWNLRFVFFSNQSLYGVKTVVSGDISDWLSIQPLADEIQANDQIVFAASISVPQDAGPGSYNGTIEISDENESLLAVPVFVNVAEPLEISEGLGNNTGELSGNGWDYYYLDMAAGTAEFQASLNWQQDANLDLFLLSPTSEYYSAEESSKGSGDLLQRQEEKTIENPPSGRWIIAIHSENASKPVAFDLKAERSQLETEPQRWNLEAAAAGSSVNMSFGLLNMGRRLDGLNYSGVIENSTSEDVRGTAPSKEIWEYSINATNSTKKISADLYSDDQTNTSELMMVLETPEGKPYDALLDTGDLGPLEISNPENGTWKIKVYGYDVPMDGQSFRIRVKVYAEHPWSWILTSGPSSLKSNENGSLMANLRIPAHTAVARMDGFIKIASGKHSFEIPVSVTVAGTRLSGLSEENVSDSDGDGLFDALSLGFGINLSANNTASSEYRLNGQLVDCSGNKIEGLDRSFMLNRSGIVSVNVSGTEIWRNGRCGPMQIKNLILYDQDGTYIDRFERDIILNYSPNEFQPPAAYLTGEYVNRTTSNVIGIGVNLTVIKPGRYELDGTIVNDYNELLDDIRLQSDLAAGNATMLLQFDPTEFIRIGEVSAVHLVNLVLLSDGAELERVDYAWATGEMDSSAFSSARSAKGISSGLNSVKLGGSYGSVRQDNNGTLVIS